MTCLLEKTFLSLCTVLLYRLTGKLINYFRKPRPLRIVQWRATPSGSFREPVDYKGQEPSNLVFSEFRRSLHTAKLFGIKPVDSPTGFMSFLLVLYVVCCSLVCLVRGRWVGDNSLR